MKAKKTSRYISTALLSSLMLTFVSNAYAQETAVDEEKPKPTKYVPEEDAKTKIAFFQGFTLSADILGIGQYFLSDYGSTEAALRLNLKTHIFLLQSSDTASVMLQTTTQIYATRQVHHF